MLRVVDFSFVWCLKSDLWLFHRNLKVTLVCPMYSTSPSVLSTSALYTRDCVWHFPAKGQLDSPPLQLQPASSSSKFAARIFLLWAEMMDFIAGMQL